MEAFAKENKKTLGQVRETYSFLVNGRIFEFSDEGREAEGDGKDGKDGKGKDGGGGKRRGGRGVARRFEREMRGGRYVILFENFDFHSISQTDNEGKEFENDSTSSKLRFLGKRRKNS